MPNYIVKATVPNGSAGINVVTGTPEQAQELLVQIFQGAINVEVTEFKGASFRPGTAVIRRIACAPKHMALQEVLRLAFQEAYELECAARECGSALYPLRGPRERLGEHVLDECAHMHLEGLYDAYTFVQNKIYVLGEYLGRVR